MRSMRIHRIIDNGRNSLKKASLSDKEIKRFSEIYATVYGHARKKGQTHQAALKYCWNVYSEQAPDIAKKIIRNTARSKMGLNKQSLRKMIIKEMLEGDVVNITDFRKQPAQPELGDEVGETQQGYDGFLSEMHNQLINFMNEGFADLTPEQSTFLDNILDMLEEELGIDEEEGIVFDEDEDFEDDL